MEPELSSRSKWILLEISSSSNRASGGALPAKGAGASGPWTEKSERVMLWPLNGGSPDISIVPFSSPSFFDGLEA